MIFPPLTKIDQDLLQTHVLPVISQDIVRKDSALSVFILRLTLGEDDW